MKLELRRNWLLGDTTIGELYIDEKFECYTLEDQVRTKKVYGETAIPYGTYPVVLTHSPKFGRTLPLVLYVPEFAGIRIHPGNSNKDTKGCILVGEKIQGKRIYNSKKAFERLYQKLQWAEQRKEKISLFITAPDVKKGMGLLGVLLTMVLGRIAYKKLKMNN